MLCIRGTSHGPASVCVCPSVRLSQVGVLLKRLNVGSHKQHHTIAQGLLFSDAKDLHEIRPGSPPTRAPNAGGVGQNRRLSTNNRLYLENGKHIVLLKSNRKSYALYRMVALPMTLSAPQTTPFSAFCTAIHSFVMGEPGDFKFGTLTYHSTSNPAEEKSSAKGAWSGSNNPF